MLEITLASDTVRPGETLVVAWSIESMTAEDLREINDDEDGFGIAVEGFYSSVNIEVASGEVGPCDPVPSPRPGG